MAKNRIFTKSDGSFVKSLCSMLDLQKDYCNSAVNQLEANEFIIESPPKFNDQEIAEAFIKDAIKIGFPDRNLHLFELNWLKFVAEANNLDKNWCIIQLQNHLNQTSAQEMDPNDLEINHLLNL
ncbi:MAG: hypothetical protein SCALA702_09730 [Melioribacteraceae bacterium]|nr:MAG: hypothetical protein SCALA702_09730 [Melioribacteraceae bacterium]